MTKKFKHIEPPYGFRDFYSKYPHGYSIYEALLEWVQQVNDLTDLVGNLPANIQEYTQEELNQMLLDGRLETLINETVFEGLNEDIQTLKRIFVSVKDFGAVGDGVNDDTQAFKTALSENSYVHVPEGVYRVTETIVVERGKALVGFNTVTRDVGAGSIIKYVGPVNPMATVVQLGGNVVGAEPTLDTSQVRLENIIIDGGNLAGFGVYGTYLTNETVVNNVTVENTTEHGFYFAKGWYATLTNLVARKNQGCGISLGMPLRLSSGTSFTWTTSAPLELNNLYISKIRAHTNGMRYTVPANLKDGYGIGFGVGNSFKIKDFLSEANTGAGVYCLTDFQYNKTLEFGYIENNFINETDIAKRYHLIIDNLYSGLGNIRFVDLFFNQASGGILHTGLLKELYFTGCWRPNFFKSNSVTLDELLQYTIVKESSPEFTANNIQEGTMREILRATVNTRYSYELHLPVKYSSRCLVYARRISADVAPVGSISATLFNGTTATVNLTDVTSAEFTLIRTLANPKKLVKSGAAGTVDSNIEIVIVASEPNTYSR